MSSAAFVDSLDQWRFARAHLPADCLLATADMEVEVEARREGRIVTSLWQGIDVADTSRNFERSRQVCELVGETLRQRLAPRYVGLADFVKWDIRNSALYVLNSYTVVERCLARAEPTQAWVFPEMAKSVFYDPIDHPCDLFNAVAAVSARRVGCEVTILPPLPPVSEAPRAEPATGRPIPAALRCGGRPLEVVDFLSSLGWAEQDLLIDRVIERDWPWLFVTDGGGRPDVALARWRLLDRLPLHGVGDLHDQLSHCPAWLLEALAGRDESWLNIFAEPELGFLWRSLAYWTEAAYRWHQVGHLLAEAWRPSLILTAYETPGTTRALRAGFHQHAVDSLSINHSGLGAEVSYQRHQGAEGYLAVLGEIEQASTRRYRGQPERVLVMGSLRRDFAVQRAAAPPRAPGETPVVVLLTGRGGQLYHPSYLPLRHLEAMRQIREVALRNPCIRFVIKQHPRYNHDLLYRLLGLQELPNVVLTTEELGSVLKSATLAVLLHYNGTAGLDVLGRGIPLLYLGTGRTVEPSFVDILEGGARAVESVSELEQEIRKLASDPAAREDLVAEQAGFYGRAVHAAGAAAVDVCLRLVERLRRPDDPAEMSACEPRLRWIVDMVLTVQEALDGHVDWHHRDADFRLNTCLRALRSRAAALDFSAVPHLEIPRLGSYLLALAVWERRRPDALSCSQLPRLRLLLAVYRTLPPALRPSLKCLRGYARAACLLDAHAPDCPAPLAASLHLLCALLSPGLWLRGCLHPPGAPPAGVAV